MRAKRFEVHPGAVATSPRAVVRSVPTITYQLVHAASDDHLRYR